MRAGVGTLVALIALLVGAGLSPGQKVLDENPYYLRSDPRLQVTLNVESRTPTLAQIVASLRDATGLDLTVDASLQGHQPNYGVLQHSKSGFHAWQLMEMVARINLERGYWDKTDQGYCLKGKSLIPVGQTRAEEVPVPGLGVGWPLAVGGVLLVVLLVLLALRRWGRGMVGRVPAGPKQTA